MAPKVVVSRQLSRVEEIVQGLGRRRLHPGSLAR